MAAGVGSAAGSMLLVGALVAWTIRVPQAVISGIMAFGAGVLISALAYELVQEANDGGGLVPTVAGFVTGAVLYVGADALLARAGARHRKRVSVSQSGTDGASNGTAIAVGSLLDGVPESIVLGLSVAGGGAVGLPMLAAVAISNIPEGLSSSAGMKASGRGAAYIFGVWSSIVVASGLAAGLGAVLLDGAAPEVVAFVTTIAAGGILAMVSNTMIPEAFAKDRSLTGLYATLGFLSAFVLHELG